MSKNSKTFKAVVGISFALIFTLSSTAGAAITSFLKPGSRSSEVKELQQFLNGCSAETMVASTGAGSPGYETSYFGPATTAAVKAFQTKMGLTADALVGAKTRAAITTGCGGSTNNGGGLPAGCTSTSGYSPTTGAKCDGSSSTSGGAVSMDASTPSANTILIATQSGANLLGMKFTGNYTVTNVKLMRTGISANATLSNIYLFDGNTRLTDAASVNNVGEITFNQPSGLFTVSGSRVITVRSDIASGSAGQTVGVSFVSAMAGTETLSGSAAGYNYGIATNPSTLSTVALTGTPTPSGATLNTGAAQTVWQSTANIGNDVYLDRVAFRQTGSAPASAFANFKLYVNGVQVATAAGLDSNGYVTFVPTSPVMMASGSRIMRVDADIVSGASRTVHFSLRTAADAGFRDAQLGVYVSATGLPEAPASASTISGASGGTLTITKDTTSPSTTVVVGGSDVSLAVFKATAFGEPVKIETLTVGGTFDGTQGSTNDAAVTLRNGRLLIGGAQYGSTATLVPAGTSFTTNFTVYPGTPVMIEVRGDVYDNDGTGTLDSSDTILITLIQGSSNGQKMDSLGTLNVPTSNTSANQLTASEGTMTLSKNGTYGDQTTTLPVSNFKIGSWNLNGSSVENILVTTLSFDVDEVVSTEFDEGDITNMYAVVKDSNGNVVAQPSPISTVSATDNNFSINYTLAKSANVTIELYGDLADDGSDSAIDALDSFKTDLTVTGISLTGGSSVTATSADTDGQTIAYGAPTLTAVVDATSPVIALVSDNQTIDSAAFKFTALTSEFKVTDLTVTIPAAAATIASDIYLYDGATLVGSRSAGTTTLTFSGLNWMIPANSSKVLTVKLKLGTIASVGGGTTGATLTTTITSFTATATSTGVSDVSGNDTGPSIENDPAGVALIARAAYPTFSQVNVSTALVNAIENDMMSFTVTPNGGPVALKQLKFTVVVNDNVGTDDTLTVGSFKLFRGSTDITSLVDIHNTAGATIESTNSLAEGTSTAIVTWSTEEQISTATTFTLKATPTGFTTAADDDYISTNLAYDSSAQTSGNVYLVDLDQTTAQVTIGLQNSAANASDGTIGVTVTTGPNIVWSDLSSVSHAATAADDADGTQDAPTSSADWINGYLVQSLPLTASTKNN